MSFSDAAGWLQSKMFLRACLNPVIAVGILGMRFAGIRVSFLMGEFVAWPDDFPRLRALCFIPQRMTFVVVFDHYKNFWHTFLQSESPFMDSQSE
jgi:hypothetical protein